MNVKVSQRTKAYVSLKGDQGLYASIFAGNSIRPRGSMYLGIDVAPKFLTEGLIHDDEQTESCVERGDIEVYSLDPERFISALRDMANALEQELTGYQEQQAPADPVNRKES